MRKPVVHMRVAPLLTAALAVFSVFPAVPDPFRAASAEESREPFRLTILHTNDMHGAIKPVKAGRKESSAGGFARIHAYASSLRKEAAASGGSVFLVDAGDFWQGTPEGSLTKGAFAMELMNLMAYDLAVPGNHEFDAGVECFEKLAKAAKFPFLAANIVLEAGGKPAWAKPSLMLAAGPVKVGFFGIACEETPMITTPGSTAGLRFLHWSATAAESAAALRAEGADVVVAVSHSGVGTDIEIAKSIAGVDLVIGGHSHTILKAGIRPGDSGCLVVQAGSSALFLGRVDIAVDPASRRIAGMTAALVQLEGPDAPEDGSMAALIENRCRDLDSLMDVVIGSAEDVIRRGGHRHAGESSPLGNLVADAMRLASGTDIAFHNRGGIRRDLGKGDITLRDVFKACPFGNTIIVMELSGRQIKSVFEYALASDARFLLEVSGAEVVYSCSGGRADIESVRVAGSAVDPGRTYKVAASSFIAAGGDGHGTFAESAAKTDTGLVLRDVVADYIKKNAPIRPDAAARVSRKKNQSR